MIVALIGYGLIVSALAALAAWLVERAQDVFGRPRRHAWIGGIVVSLLVPVFVISFGAPGEGVVSMLVTAVQPEAPGAAGLLASAPTAASLGGEANGGWLDAWLAALWALTSGALAGVYAFSAWKLARRARTWRAARVGTLPVVVAPDIGPAVFGWIRSRVVFPRWLTEAPEAVQCLALAHEYEHLRARDPQVLSVATLLGVLLPWNLPLLWMLRRLRFAMEVDCDARVVRRGADPNEYGLALLYVSERQSRAPITAIALIERKSQLERRIDFMFKSRRKYPAVIAGVCIALAGYCLAAAGQLEAPALATSSPVLKPPPDENTNGYKLGQQFEQHIRENYPELMGGNFEGMPIVVALLDADWGVAKSVRTVNPDSNTDGRLKVTRELFGVLGLAPHEVPYSGAMTMQMAPGKFVAVAYTEQAKPGEEFVSKRFRDTRDLDRELFAREFPGAYSGLAPDKNHWVLLDRSGLVLRKGIEPVSSSRELQEILEQRFGGIDTQEVTVTHVTDESGKPKLDAAGKSLQLWSVWLAPGSPPPKN